MKQPSTDLHELIKSLSPNEKGYYKKQLKLKRSDSNIEALFNFIDGQDQYDELAIQEHFKEEKFIKQLSRTKNYLYHSILQSLRNYHSRVYARIQVKNMVSEIEILFSKALYRQCYDYIQVTKRKAVKYECFLSLIEILVWEMEVAKYVHPFEKVGLEIDISNLQLEGTIESLINLLRYYQINSKVAKHYKNSPLGELGQNEIAYMKALGNSFPISNEAAPQSVEAKFLRLKIKGYLNMMIGAYDNAIEDISEAIELIEVNTFFMHEHPKYYLEVLNRLGVLYIITKQYNNCEELAKKYEKMTHSIDELKIKSVQHKLNLISANVIESRNLSGINKRMEEFENDWNKYHDKFEPEFKKALGFNLFYLCFVTGRLSDANKYLQFLEYALPFELRTDISNALVMGYFTLNADLGNWNLIESRARSIVRSTKKVNSNLKFIANQFLKLTRSGSKDPDEVYQEILELLNNKTRDDEFQAALWNFDMTLWIKSKLNRQTFQEVFVAVNG